MDKKIGSDLDSFAKARRAVSEDKADVTAINLQINDLLVKAGLDEFEALKKTVRAQIISENEHIENGPAFKVEYDIRAVVELSLGHVILLLRFHGGAFPDAFGPRNPHLEVTLAPNPRTVAFDPALRERLSAVMGAVKIPPVESKDVRLISEDGATVFWRINNELVTSSELAGDLLAQLANYYKANAPPNRGN